MLTLKLCLFKKKGKEEEVLDCFIINKLKNEVETRLLPPRDLSLCVGSCDCVFNVGSGVPEYMCLQVSILF